MDETGVAATRQTQQTIAATGYESSPGGAFLFPTTPNIVDFLGFLTTSVQIPAAALPPTSVWPQYALNQALELTLRSVGGILYTLAVYNCATHLVFMITPDVVGQNFFANARSNKGYALVNPSMGIVSATSDQGTSASLASPMWARGMTVAQLGFFKTPWGREYLDFIQAYGPTIVGLT